MNSFLKSFMCGLTVCLLAGCSGSEQGESSGAGYASAPATSLDRVNAAQQQAMLAYEHDVSIRLAADAIPARLQTVRAACEAARFGGCVVLGVSEQGGELPGGSLTVRIAPAGVEPMIQLAAQDGALDKRDTHAEDLAVVVRDNDLEQSRLKNERERLLEFQQRGDLAVADMIALSKELAQADAQLQVAEQAGAQHRRRIDTQLLALRFEPPGGERGRSEIGSAVSDFGHTLSAGTAWTIRALAFLLPVGMVLVILVAVIRRIRRRR